MKQRYFHLLALLSLLSISSFSFGMQESPVRGRIAYVEKEGVEQIFEGRPMVHFKPENLEAGSEYKIEGKEYMYQMQVTLEEGGTCDLFFCMNDAQDQLGLKQEGGIYLITHEYKNGCLVPVNNNKNNPSEIHDNQGDNSDGLPDKGSGPSFLSAVLAEIHDNQGDNLPDKGSYPSFLSAVLGRYKTYK